MFENFTETINPDNRFFFTNQEKTDELIIGADVTHIFEVPFLFFTTAEYAVVIYQQGLNKKWLFYVDKSMVTEDKLHGISFISVHLPPEKTREFSTTLLTTYSQLQITLASGDIIYDRPHQIIIKKPLI